MTAAVLAGLLAGYGIAIPVGPVGAYLVALTARSGWRTGAAGALGVATVDGGYALVAVVGGSALAAVLAPAEPVLRWVAVLLLVVLGARTVLSATSTGMADVASAAPWRTYANLVGLTAVNPTTVIYFVALVVGSAADRTVAEHAAFVVAAFVASASWQLLLAGGGALLGRAVSGPRGRRLTAVASGLVMLALAVRMATSG